jgi:hypothetical protein
MGNKPAMFSCITWITLLSAFLLLTAGCDISRHSSGGGGGVTVVMTGNHKATITQGAKQYTIEFDAATYPTGVLDQASVQLIDPATVNQTGYPAGYVFPDGLVSFVIKGLTAGQTIKVKVAFPTPFAPGTSFYKSRADGFHLYPLAVIVGNTVELTLQDGGPGDSDTVSGQITDPVGPVHPPAPGEVSPARFDFTQHNGTLFPASWTLYINAAPGQSWSIYCGESFSVYPPQGTGKTAITVIPRTGAMWPEAINSSQCTYRNLSTNTTQTVNTRVFTNGTESTPPFGEFSTPQCGSTVSSSIPVTGWALDDVGVESVKIYRSQGQDLVYVGDAVFVEGARPDIEALYPSYPQNNRAGWGYMLLTNYLPDGTHSIFAKATDATGNTVTLGSKTISVDNAHAVKPFGALDTPLSSGTSTLFKGWVLTPQPNTIPADGSTIQVWVDGVNLGHAHYNYYRQDIAALFPGYNNSNNAGGFFEIDTAPYSNGVHTIQWTATDNAGNTDGIGSRYFTIQNSSP